MKILWTLAIGVVLVCACNEKAAAPAKECAPCAECEAYTDCVECDECPASNEEELLKRLSIICDGFKSAMLLHADLDQHERAMKAHRVCVDYY